MTMLSEPPSRARRIADIVAYDRDDSPVLVAEVKGNIKDEAAAREQLVQYLKAVGKTVSFGMLADKRNTQFFLWDGIQLTRPIASMQTKDIVSLYDPEFYSKIIYEFYLATLLSSWLRDIIFHWKSQEPPEYKVLKDLGLVERLSGGAVFTEVPIR